MNFEILTLNAGKQQRVQSNTMDLAVLSLLVGADGLSLAQGGSGGGAYFDFGSRELRSSASPSNANSLVTKSYVDALSVGTKWKEPARAATTGNITLSAPQTIDGVSILAGDRVLVRAQTAGEENGIYVAAAGAWARADDANTALELNNAAVFVSEGTLFADNGFVMTTDSVTLGTTPLTWVIFTSQAIVAGAGLTRSGNTLDVVAANASIVVGANDIAVQFDAAGAMETSGSGIRARVDADTLKIASNNLAVDHAVTLTNDSGSTIAAGRFVRVKANGNIAPAAKAEATLWQEAIGFTEVSILDAASGKVVVRRGAVLGGFSSLTIGEKYYINTAGQVATFGGLTLSAGDDLVSVGRALSATQIVFDPQFEYEH